MIKLLRKTPDFCFVLLFTMAGIVRGLDMMERNTTKTWLCFDAGCITVQGQTLIVLSVGSLLVYAIITLYKALARWRHRRRMAALRELKGGPVNPN